MKGDINIQPSETQLQRSITKLEKIFDAISPLLIEIDDAEEEIKAYGQLHYYDPVNDACGFDTLAQAHTNIWET